MNDSTQPLPGNADALAGLLEGAGAVRKPKAAKPEAATVEPTMRALRRIIGDDVLSIFPEGFTDQVDALYAVHSKADDEWTDIPCDSVQERNDLHALMRAYGECAGDKGYTVRQDRTAEPTVLRVRVITRKRRGNVAEDADND